MAYNSYIMKIIRFFYKDEIRFGVLKDGGLVDFISSPFEGEPVKLGLSAALKDVRLLAPTAPSKVVAAGLNYTDHKVEMKEEDKKEPVFFIKPSTSVIAYGDDVPLYPWVGRTDYEGELAVVIGKSCRNVTASEAKDFILGFTVLNDVTARTLQKADGQWTRAKSFDGYCPMGPYIVTDADVSDAELTTRKNGAVVQKTRTSNMIWNVYEMVAAVSRFTTLLPGDVVSTGTPSGIGEAFDGDVVEITVEGVGTLKNTYRLKE